MAMSVIAVMIMVIVAGLSFGRAIKVGVFVIVGFQGVAKLCLRSDSRSIPDTQRSQNPGKGGERTWAYFRGADFETSSNFSASQIFNSD